MEEIENRNDVEDENDRLEKADQDLSEENENETTASLNTLLLPSELHTALITNDKATLLQMLDENSAVQLADALRPLSDNEIVLFFSMVSSDYDKLGEIFSYLTVDEREALIDNVPRKSLLSILANVSDDDLSDFLGDTSKKERNKILAILPSGRRKIIENLLRYLDDTVGSIMTTECLSVKSGTVIKEVFDLIKKIGKTRETIRRFFIIDNTNKLIGVERLEDLMFENQEKKIDEVMATDFVYISPIAPKEEAISICKEYDLSVLPVVNKSGELLGIITFDDVMDVIEEANTEDVLKQGAVSPTDGAYMENGVFRIVRSYVIWLIILLVINTFTGIIISRFEAALMTLPILTSFIPALNDSCGNSGSQTTSMVIRALTTEDIRKSDYFKIVGREFLTGLITGLIVAVFNFGWMMFELNTPILKTDEAALIASFNNLEVAYMIISGIVSFSLFFGITLSKTLASILPMLAKAVKIDPAVMSGPLITTIMDILTLLVYFTSALTVLSFVL